MQSYTITLDLPAIRADLQQLPQVPVLDVVTASERLVVSLRAHRPNPQQLRGLDVSVPLLPPAQGNGVVRRHAQGNLGVEALYPRGQVRVAVRVGSRRGLQGERDGLDLPGGEAWAEQIARWSPCSPDTAGSGKVMLLRRCGRLPGAAARPEHQRLQTPALR